MKNRFKSIIKKLGRLGFSIKSEKNGHIDPVCRMESSGDLFKADYKGESYYFCSDHCQGQFIANPGNYVD